MKELNFDTGLVSYKLNGKVEITFNPTDINFHKKLINTLTELSKIDEERIAKTENADTEDVFDISEEYDKKMRAMIDETLGVPVCDAVFGDMNLFFSFADGFPVCCNLIVAILEEFPESFTKELEAANPRIKRYTEKYEKKFHK